MNLTFESCIETEFPVLLQAQNLAGIRFHSADWRIKFSVFQLENRSYYYHRNSVLPDEDELLTGMQWLCISTNRVFNMGYG